MTQPRLANKIAGALFIIATITYGLGASFIVPTLTAPDYLSQLAQLKTQVIIGVLLQWVDAAAVVGIAVLFFPTLKNYSESVAVGYLATRIMECALLLVSGLSVLLLVILSQEYGANATEAVNVLGTLLVAGNKLGFQVAMLALGVGSLPFCYLLYQTQLIPVWQAILGLVGYVALCLSAILEILGYNTGVILYLPGGLFELIFPIWLMLKGFHRSE